MTYDYGWPAGGGIVWLDGNILGQIVDGIRMIFNIAGGYVKLFRAGRIINKVNDSIDFSDRVVFENGDENHMALYGLKKDISAEEQYSSYKKLFKIQDLDEEVIVKDRVFSFMSKDDESVYYVVLGKSNILEGMCTKKEFKRIRKMLVIL